jgi:carboxypeptidase Q
MKCHLLLIGFLCGAVSIAAAQDKTPPNAAGNRNDEIARIVGYATTRGGALKFLETLTDTVGGRVTGSAQSYAASDLILKKLKNAGFETAHFEEYSFESGWQRGPAHGQVISPVTAPLYVGSYGWAPGTPGRIESPVVDLGTPASNDIPKTAQSLRGYAVLVDVHSVGNAPTPVMRALIARQLAQAGAAAMLIPSDKPDRMLYTSAYGLYPRAPLPVLSVGREDTLFLRRLLAKGPVKIALDIQNSFTGSAKERNVVADLPGTNPEETVLVGAHFDSWDPAQGADDNGSGVASVLEAARVLKSLGITPRCTIRFAFFSGEEEANLGSRAYVEMHKAELDRLRAFLLMDDGAQLPLGFATNGRDDLISPLQKILQPLAVLGAGKIGADADMESDNASFMVAGVPSLTLQVEPGDYDIRHHAITDTFDKIDARKLALDTAVMAVAAFSIADAETWQGRRLSPNEVQELLKRTGLQSAQDLQFGPLQP